MGPPTKLKKPEDVITEDQTTGEKNTENSYTHSGTGNVYGSNPPSPPHSEIYEYKWANKLFPIKLKANKSIGENDADNTAATQFLSEQFQYSNNEITETLEKYKLDKNRGFWHGYFEEKTINELFFVSETCGGYLWRLFRYDQSKYQKKRDFLILLLIEYRKDNKKFNNPKQLNEFIRKVNELKVDLTPTSIQQEFYLKEEANKREWLDFAQRKENRRIEKLFPNTPKRSINEPTKSSANTKNLEKEAQIYQENYEEKTLNKPLNYQDTAKLAALSLLQKALPIDLKIQKKTKEKLEEENDFSERLGKYLEKIALQQVKYNYVASQNKPLSYSKLKSYQHQIDVQMGKSIGGKRAAKIIALYKQINKKYKIVRLENIGNNIDNKPITGESDNTHIDKSNWESGTKYSTAIQNKIESVKKDQNIKWVSHYSKQNYWKEGEIPSSLYLTDEIIYKIIFAKPEEINDQFLLRLINQNDIGSFMGFRNSNRGNLLGDSKAFNEFKNIKEFLLGKEQLRRVRYVNETYLKSGDLIPIKSVILPKVVNKQILKTIPIELRIYLKKIGENNWQVIDLTNPANKNPNRPSAKGSSDKDAIEKALTLFNKNSTDYVPGRLVVQAPIQFSDKVKMYEFIYTGTSWEKEWSKRMETIGKVMSNIGMVMRLIPHPFARLASSGFMLVGQIAGGTNAALNITQRIKLGTFKWNMETVNDALDVITTVSGTAGKAVKKSGSVKLFFNTADKVGETAGYVLIPLTLQSQIDKIKNNNTKTDIEKQLEIQELVKSTVWSQGKQLFFDKVTSSISSRNEQRENTNKKLIITAKNNQKNKKAKYRDALPKVTIMYEQLGSNKIAELETKNYHIKLNKNIGLNRKKRFKGGIKEEKSHIWVKLLNAVEPDIYNAAINSIKKTDNYVDFIKSKEGERYATKAKQQGYKGKQLIDYLAEEFLGKVIAKDIDLKLTSSKGFIPETYKKMLKAIDRLLQALGINDTSLTMSQLNELVKSGQRQMDGKSDRLTFAKSSELLAFLNGEAGINISILGKRYKNVSLNQNASRDILFRDMNQLNNNELNPKSDNLSYGNTLEIENLYDSKNRFSKVKKRRSQDISSIEEFYKDKRFLGDPLINISPIRALMRYKEIVEKTNAHEAISKNLMDSDKLVKFDEKRLKDIINVAKKHLFIKEHIIFNQIKGKVLRKKGRFSFQEYKIDLWYKFLQGYEGQKHQKIKITTEEIQQYKSLIAHEYIESKLMDTGILFRTLDESKSIGAHNLSINENHFDFSHYSTLGLDPNIIPKLETNLSNIDEVVIAIIKLKK